MDHDLPEGAQPIETKGTFQKWDKRGQRVQGTLLRMELSKKYEGENYVLTLRDDDGKKIAVSAPLKLREAVEDNELIGKRVVIIYSDDTPSKGGTVKEFKIGILPPIGDAFEK
jgi:hypothetical protein